MLELHHIAREVLALIVARREREDLDLNSQRLCDGEPEALKRAAAASP